MYGDGGETRLKGMWPYQVLEMKLGKTWGNSKLEATLTLFFRKRK